MTGSRGSCRSRTGEEAKTILAFGLDNQVDGGTVRYNGKPWRRRTLKGEEDESDCEQLKFKVGPLWDV